VCGMDSESLTVELNNASERDSGRIGKPKYDKFNVETEITKDFKFSIGMEFSSLQLFKDVVQELNVLNDREIKFAQNDKWRVRAVCKFNKKCGYTIFVSRVVRPITFRVGTICPEHTCGRVSAKKSFKSKQVAKVVVKHNNKEEQPAIQQLPKAAPKKRVTLLLYSAKLIVLYCYCVWYI